MIPCEEHTLYSSALLVPIEGVRISSLDSELHLGANQEGCHEKLKHQVSVVGVVANINVGPNIWCRGRGELCPRLNTFQQQSRYG